MIVLLFVSGLLCLLCAHLLVNVVSLRRLCATAKVDSPSDPFVSLLVPARNEEAHIEICVRSLVGQWYDRLEVLVLDDQSSDATATIVQGMMSSLPEAQKGRLRLVRGEALPPGWVGKNYACHQLYQQAQGDYLFFTDADTVHAPGTTRAVIEYMQSRDVALLTAQFGYKLKGIAERLLVPLLYFRVFTLLPMTLVSRRPEPILAAGNGPLLCFQRRAYKAAGGHQAIKGCILEDVSLARAVKAAGYRMAFVDALDLVYCHMYASFRDTWEGFSKTFFAFYNHSLLAALVILTLDLALFVLPPLLLLLALMFPMPRPLLLLALGDYGLAVLMRLLLAARLTRFQRVVALLLCFLHPLAVLLGCLILLNSMHWHYRKRGTKWKGRYY